MCACAQALCEIISTDFKGLDAPVKKYLYSYASSATTIYNSITSTMCKILFSGYLSNKRNDNPPRMWSNTSKIGFVMIYDTFRTWVFSPVLYRRHLGYGYGLAI